MDSSKGSQNDVLDNSASCGNLIIAAYYVIKIVIINVWVVKMLEMEQSYCIMNSVQGPLEYFGIIMSLNLVKNMFDSNSICRFLNFSFDSTPYNRK